MNEVTEILGKIESGDQHATAELLPLVYEELRKLAAARIAQEKADQTLQATALVHEAYLRLVDVEKTQHWNSRGHFFAAAAEAMRRILVDRAVQRKSLKRGGDHQQVEIGSDLAAPGNRQDDILELDEALSHLSAEDPQAAELVKLRFFAGCSVTEAAEILGISRSNAYRHWAYARAALQCLLPERGQADL